MFQNLDKLLDYLCTKYEEINNLWKTSELYSDMNLKRKQIADIEVSPEILDLIWNYRTFLQTQQYKILPSISQLQSSDNKIHVRIKQVNSIQNKIDVYMNGTTSGKVPINKCFNDLIGFRIIIDADFSFEQLKAHLNESFGSLKVIDSSKDGYNAYHIYFQNENKFFPWELQVWKKCNEERNIESHRIYKQGYTTWEQKHKNI